VRFLREDQRHDQLQSLQMYRVLPFSVRPEKRPKLHIQREHGFVLSKTRTETKKDVAEQTDRGLDLSRRVLGKGPEKQRKILDIAVLL